MYWMGFNAASRDYEYLGGFVSVETMKGEGSDW
jgi:hypothetical protein